MKEKLGTGLAVLAIVIATCGIATAGHHEGLTKELAGIEKSLWAAWAQNDSKAFKETGREDAILITAMGRESLADFADDPSGDCEVFGYSLDDFQLIELGSEAAIITYRAEQDAKCSGTALPSPVMASSVYVREEGKWKWALYHESPLIEEE